MTPKDMGQVFEFHWQRLAQDREEIQYKPEKDFHTLLLQGKELLSVFHHQLPEDQSDILGIEEAFRFEIEGLPVPLIGVYDLVLEDAHVDPQERALIRELQDMIDDKTVRLVP